MHNARNRNGSRKCCYSRGRGKALKEEEEEEEEEEDAYQYAQRWLLLLHLLVRAQRVTVR